MFFYKDLVKLCEAIDAVCMSGIWDGLFENVECIKTGSMSVGQAVLLTAG